MLFGLKSMQPDKLQKDVWVHFIDQGTVSKDFSCANCSYCRFSQNVDTFVESYILTFNSSVKDFNAPVFLSHSLFGEWTVLKGWARSFKKCFWKATRQSCPLDSWIRYINRAMKRQLVNTYKTSDSHTTCYMCIVTFKLCNTDDSVSLF